LDSISGTRHHLIEAIQASGHADFLADYVTNERKRVEIGLLEMAVCAQAAQPAPHLCDELLLLIGITRGPVSPCGRGDQACEADGFGIDRRETAGRR